MLPYIHRGQADPGFFLSGWSRGGTTDMLRPAPGNEPPAEGPYLCVAPLLDAWRANPDLAMRERVPHFSTSLEPAVLGDLRAGRALLLLDMSNEGPAFHSDVFAALHGFALRSGIPFTRMVWLCQNRALPAAYRATFGLATGDGIGFAHYDFFVKFTAWQFSPACPTPLVGADPEAHAARMFDPAGKDRTLLCLNATPRLHRVLTIAGLIHHGLFDDALVSFPGVEFAKDGDVGSGDRIAAYLAANPALAHLTPAASRAASLRSLKADDFPETGNALFDKIDPAPYRRTFFSLVTETDFTRGEVDRVTEKIVKPFCLGHPTLVVGNPDTLRFMTELGLGNFAGLLDHGYDREPAPAPRLNRVLAEAAAQVAAIRRDPAAWLARARETGTANIRHAISGRLLAAYVARVERPLIEDLHRRLAATP